MGNFLNWALRVLLGVLLACGLLYAISWSMPVPKAQAEALAALESRPLPAGRNGGAALFVMPYDFPDERDPLSQADALLAPEIARFAATPFVYREDGSHFKMGLEALPMWDANIDRDSTCNTRIDGCLAKVRAAKEPGAIEQAALTRAETRMAALARYDYFRNPFQPRPDMPIPRYSPLLTSPTFHARRFVAGDVQAALDGACRDATTARKMISSGDNLITTLIGIAMLRGNSGLLVEMLGELPPDASLPAQCTRAFESDGMIASSLCPMMMGEGAYIAGNMLAVGTREDASALEGLFLDRRKTASRSAAQAMWYCGKQAQDDLRRDVALRDTPARPSPWTFGCIANVAGCLTGEIAGGFDEYALKLQDAEMQQKLVASWLWLRAHHGEAGTLAGKLQRRPPAMRSQSREILVDPDGQWIGFDPYVYGDGSQVRLPVPAWMSGKSAKQTHSKTTPATSTPATSTPAQ